MPRPQPQFDPNAPHHVRPRLRPVRGFPGQTQDGQPLLGLADARQISDQLIYVVPAFQQVLPLMDGSRTVDEISSAVGKGLTTAILGAVVAKLDEAGLLVGPKFDAMLAKMHADFDSTSSLPPASTASWVDQMIQQAVADGAPAPTTLEEAAALGRTTLTKSFDAWMEQALAGTPAPAMTSLPKAIVVPHLDYGRGWMNYASAWGRLRGLPRPDRVVVLGTNHFGLCTGVCGCDKGFESPLGVCAVDEGLVRALRTRLGEPGATQLFEHRYDHEREHSIELQIPWIQHVFGPDARGQFPAVFAALVHDPVANNGDSYDGKGLSFPAFVDALRAAIADCPGRTLVVSSADLSHFGPAFGDRVRLAGDAPEAAEARNKVFAHDREMLGMFTQGKTDELLGAMGWQQNPTRWCSLGNMLAAYQVTQPTRVEQLGYAAAIDPEGYTGVSSASLLLI